MSAPLRAAVLRPVALAAPLWLWLAVAALAADDEAAVTPVFVLAPLLPLLALGLTLVSRSWRDASRRGRAVLAATTVAAGVVVAAETLLLWLRAAEHLCGERYECPF